MINFEFNENTVRMVENKLGDMKSQTPKVLKDALNNTAKQARTDLRRKAQDTYTVKAGSFNKVMTIKKAVPRDLVAIIKTEGKPLPLTYFRTKKQEGVGETAKVLKKGKMKPLQKGNIKAFRTGVTAGGAGKVHVGLFQRTGSARLPIKQLYSNSIPKMIGNEYRVFGVVEPKIKENLQKNIEGQIKRVLGE